MSQRKLIDAKELQNGADLRELLDPIVTTECEYDIDKLNEILDVFFGGSDNPDEHILTWFNKPERELISYPVSVDTLEKELFNGSFKLPRTVYMATSTVFKDERGELRHRSSNFAGMHFLVLDDIGTKVDVSKIPPAAKPTMITETSEGNYQYAYAFDKPIRDVEVAKAMVQIIYDSGLSDSGGKLPIKAVRLPFGVNGKKGKKCAFKVTLKEFNPTQLWTPDQLLKALEINVAWEDIESDAIRVTRSRAQLNSGASLWSHAKIPSMTGVVDPLAEFLYEQDMVKGDNGEWLTVICPNAAAHTMGDDTAGYRPCGRGSDPTSRAFKCHHGHCQHITTAEYTVHIANLGGPMVAVRDTAAELTSVYVYDSADDSVWKIKGVPHPQQMKLNAFRTLHLRPVKVIDKEGKEKESPEHKLWLHSPSRVNTHAPIFAPNDPSKIVYRDGALHVNLYTPPKWERCQIDSYHIDKFLGFCEYLMPIKVEREYQLDVLAAKAQNMAFRGPAIIHMALTQGIGRSTLGSLISLLFGYTNVVNMPFKEIVGDSQFNEWQEAPFIISDETLNTSDVNSYKIYERLKDLIDPRPKPVVINTKYGRKRSSVTYTSYMFFTNHSNAIPLPESDRRTYIITNPTVPAKPEYFTEINDWMNTLDENGDPVWCPSVWSWLLSRKVDMQALLSPPAQTQAKRQMTAESGGMFSQLLRAFLNCWDSPYLTNHIVEDVVEAFHVRLDLQDVAGWKKKLAMAIRDVTSGYGRDFTMSLFSRTARPKLITARSIGAIPPSADIGNQEREEIRSSIEAAFADREALLEKFSHELAMIDL